MKCGKMNLAKFQCSLPVSPDTRRTAAHAILPMNYHAPSGNKWWWWSSPAGPTKVWRVVVAGRWWGSPYRWLDEPHSSPSGTAGIGLGLFQRWLQGQAWHAPPTPCHAQRQIHTVTVAEHHHEWQTDRNDDDDDDSKRWKSPGGGLESWDIAA